MGNWPGYWRMFKQGVIEKAFYDCDKKEAKGAYRIPSIYGYSKENTLDDLEQLSQNRVDEIYAYFHKRSDLLGVFLVNSLYYMLVYQHTVEIRLNGERLESLAYNSPTVNMIPMNWVPVGFERTICETVEALIPPGRIYANPESTVIYYKGKFQRNEAGPLSEMKNISLYKELIRNKNKNGILFSATGEHILLD